jgi:hypothetical protein
MGEALRVGLAAAVLAAAAGCADKLRYERTFTLPEDGARSRELKLPPQSVAQTVRIAVTADQPVDVYVLPEKDLQRLDAKDWGSKAIASKQGVTAETLTADIPAEQETAVVVTLGSGTAKAQVTVKMTN